MLIKFLNSSAYSKCKRWTKRKKKKNEEILKRGQTERKKGNRIELKFNLPALLLCYCSKNVYLDASTHEIEYMIIIYFGGRRENKSCIEYNSNTHTILYTYYVHRS